VPVSSERVIKREASSSGRPGAFVFVVGPSGAGKDTVLTYARDRLSGDERFVFVRRVVTRPPGQWETHDTLTEAEFAEELASGSFALSWSAHGLHYGVPANQVSGIRGGRIAICNGSRAAIPDALAVFEPMKIVLITAPREVRIARLTTRGREERFEERIDRLAHGDIESTADLVIDNVGDPAISGEKLLSFLKTLALARG